MLNDMAFNVFIINGKIFDSSIIELDESKMSHAVYEVIRIIDGIPLFLEDHIERLHNSMENAGFDDNQISFFKTNTLSKYINDLKQRYGTDNFNVKLAVLKQQQACGLVVNCGILPKYSEGDNDFKLFWLLYVSKSYYPSEKEVEEGLPVTLIEVERQNPNSKVLKLDYKALISEALSRTGAFEALLVNKEGYITEGSRSNVFFVKGSKVFTAPGDMVLKGITRKYVLEACKSIGIDVVETAVRAEDVLSFDGIFISGTSVKVQPVSEIDGKKINSWSTKVVRSIKEQFDNIIQNYVASKM